MSLLGPLDEHLNHQTSRPFRVAGTSDHRFYDRHWFEVLAPDGSLAMISGMGIYKNQGVVDGFVSVQHERLQSNVRVSRPLDDRVEPSVGPLAVEVIEPFERVRLRLEPGEHPISCDLMWTSTFSPRLEAPHLDLVDGRIVTDVSRYDQAGTWNGWIILDGDRTDVTDWWGIRDHSWGVRPDIGGYEPRLGHPKQNKLWLWAYVTTDELECHVQSREDGQGRLLFLDGHVTRLDDPLRRAHEIVALEHDITFVPGTRDWSWLRYVLTVADGSEVVIEAEPLQSAWAYRGTGYEGGFDDGRGVGVPRGDIVQHDVLDLRVAGAVTRDGEPFHPGHREQPAAVVVNGREGLGHLPVMSSGHIEKYNLGRRPS